MEEKTQSQSMERLPFGCHSFPLRILGTAFQILIARNGNGRERRISRILYYQLFGAILFSFSFFF